MSVPLKGYYFCWIQKGPHPFEFTGPISKYLLIHLQIPAHGKLGLQFTTLRQQPVHKSGLQYFIEVVIWVSLKTNDAKHWLTPGYLFVSDCSRFCTHRASKGHHSPCWLVGKLDASWIPVLWHTCIWITISFLSTAVINSFFLSPSSFLSETKPRVWHFLGGQFTTELYSQPINSLRALLW